MTHFMDHEPDPVPNTNRPVWELVIEDMKERDHVGRQRYGVPLQAHNGRRPLVDAYQEALDLVVYLRQEIEERAKLEAELTEARKMCQSLATQVDGLERAIAEIELADLESQPGPCGMAHHAQDCECEGAGGDR